MQTSPRLLFDGWSERTRLYPSISKLSLLVGILESRQVSDKQIISNLWIAIYALKRNILAKLCANMLLGF